MIRNALIAQHIFNTPLMIHPSKLDAIVYGLQERLGVEASQPESGLFTSTEGEHKQPGYRVVDGVGIIEVFGVLAHRGGVDANSSYILGYQQIASRFDAAMADPLVHTLLMIFDSPGGSVSGAFDLAQKIYEARGDKKIIAMADDAMMSAAYLIASAADELLVTNTSNVGSIGVLMAHVDVSKAMDEAGYEVTYIFSGDHKVDGNPYEALPADVRDGYQNNINTVKQMFVDVVARNRNMKAQSIIDTQAQIYLGPDAIGLGLADSVSTPDKLIARLVAEYNGADSHLSLTSSKKEITMSDEDKPKAGSEDKAPAKIETKASGDEPVKTDITADQARIDERQRMAAIMDSDEAVGREVAARAFATETDMSVEAAKATLSKMPAVSADKVSKLDAAMAKTTQPNIGSEGGDGEDQETVATVNAIANGVAKNMK